MKRAILSVTLFALVLSSTCHGQSGGASQTPAAAQGTTPVLKQRVNRPARKPVVTDRERKTAADATPAQSGNGRASAGKPNRQSHAPSISFSDALRRCRHDSHNHVWWKQHYTTIVFVTGGYYYYDAGYWFPAWGYDPQFDYHDYDGPIYTYGNLLPDQVVLNVQRALKELGYYNGPLNGSLGEATRAAIGAYQEDAGLYATGAIDESTVEALGLY